MQDTDEQGTRPSVLIVDDDETQRLLLREVLDQLGFIVEEADDGIVGLELARRRPPDLVLLDVLMPNMDGFEVCRQLRKLPELQHTPVLIITGSEDLESIQSAYEVGATDFISKPINWTILGQRLRYMHRANCAMKDLRVSQERLTEAQEIARLASWQWDPRTQTLECSEQLQQILGIEPGAEPLTYKKFLSRVHHDDRDHFRWSIEDGLRTGHGFELEFRVALPDQSERIVSARTKIAGNRGRMVIKGTCQDVTELRETEARLHHLAYHDALTNLPNRTLFHDRLGQAIARADRDGSKMAILCIDLDHFKEVNDTLGHAAGDKLLEEASDRMRCEIRGSDTLSRLGGDEFAIVQTGVGRAENAHALCNRIVSVLSQPFNIDGHEIAIGASLGLAMYPDHGSDPQQILMNADIALYEAKAQGRNCFWQFVEGMDDRLRDRKEMERDLRQALAEDGFHLVYQPQVLTSNMRIVGVEALLRFDHPVRGPLPPDEFVPLAEETGLIVPLGEWILRKAIAQASEWRRQGLDIRVAVNTSPTQFRQLGLAAIVGSLLEDYQVDPNLLEIEITESVLMSDTASALSTLEELRRLGVSIAMDDFGTGYSSLGYLKMFPFDRMKIDRSFVQDLGKSEDSATIVRAAIALGDSLSIPITAEGVETQAQLAFLRTTACSEFQGFYFSEPVAADKIADLVQGQQIQEETVAV